MTQTLRLPNFEWWLKVHVPESLKKWMNLDEFIFSAEDIPAIGHTILAEASPRTKRVELDDNFFKRVYTRAERVEPIWSD
jgi:hypothetical protein